MKNPGGHEYNLIPVMPSQIRYADYQRGGIERHIEDICDNYNGDVQNEPKLSYRDNVYWCFDGQQTISAWTRKFGDVPILCKVYSGLTYKEEARLFAIQSNNIKIHPLKIFDSNLKSEDQSAVDINNAVKLAGYRIPKTPSHANDAIQCVGALRKAYMKIGSQGISDVLLTIRNAWGYTDFSTNAKIVEGMIKFYAIYHDAYEMKDLISSLRKNGCMPIDILNSARSMGGKISAINIARVILMRYNHGRRNRLPEKL